MVNGENDKDEDDEDGDDDEEKDEDEDKKGDDQGKDGDEEDEDEGDLGMAPRCWPRGEEQGPTSEEKGLHNEVTTSLNSVWTPSGGAGANIRGGVGEAARSERRPCDE